MSAGAGPTSRFEAQRPLAFSIAYRMLGSKAEAEDIVQEAWLRWRESDPGALDSDRAWLSTIVTRLCLDHLKSARVRRETYPGPWLPEPLVGAPEERAPLDSESISMAFMLLLESLSPLERAVFLLSQVFDYSHMEIAGIIGRSEAASRQALSRAKRQLKAKRPRFASSRQSHERLLTAFLRAAGLGDLKALTTLFAEDVTAISDGGGKVKAALRPISGRDAVARGIAGGARRLAVARFEYVDVNGWPGALLWIGDRLEGVISIECDDDHIHAIHAVVNPDKLRRIRPR